MSFCYYSTKVAGEPNFRQIFIFDVWWCIAIWNRIPFPLNLADPDDLKSTELQHNQDIHPFKNTPWKQAEVRKKPLQKK
jgi:hypothetical protein